MSAQGPPTIQDDLKLATACSAGEEEAWQRFLTTYRSFMIDFAKRIVGETDAADLVDRVIADLWQRRKLAAYEGRSSLRTWIGAVISHAALNARRERRPAMESTLVNSDGPPRDRVADAESLKQFRSVLFEAIRRLSAEDRLLLLLHYEQGLTLDQISTLLGSSKSTLSRRVARARQDVFDAAGVMARERYGESIQALWQQLSPERLDFDLRAACAPSLRNDPDRNVSNL